MSKNRKLILVRHDEFRELVFVRFDGGIAVVSEDRKDAKFLSNMRHAQETLSKLRRHASGGTAGEWQIVNLIEENAKDGVQDRE